MHGTDHAAHAVAQDHYLVGAIPIGSERTDDRVRALDRLGDGGDIGDAPRHDPHALTDRTEGLSVAHEHEHAVAHGERLLDDQPTDPACATEHRELHTTSLAKRTLGRRRHRPAADKVVAQ